MCSPTDEPGGTRVGSGGTGGHARDGARRTGQDARRAQTRNGRHAGTGADPPADARAGRRGGGTPADRERAVLHVVLYQPQIPQNTGNVARTCAAVGADLHLIEPLGFSVTESAVRRAGLDYWRAVTVRTHAGLEPVLGRAAAPGGQLVLLSTHGARPYTEFRYRRGAYLLFGNETAGLPAELRARYAVTTARIPMRRGLRSLNLANAVAVVVYEALRQLAPPHLV